MVPVLSQSVARFTPLVSAPAGYSSAVLADSPYLYWRLDDSSGTTAADASGNGKTGTYGTTGGSYTFGQTSLCGDSNNSVRFQTNANVRSTFVLNTSDATVEFIVKFATGSVQSFSTLAGFQQSGLSDKVLTIDGSNHLSWTVFPGGGVTMSTSLPENTTLHIAATIGAAGQYLYINGSQVASNGSSTTSYTGFSTNDVVIGAQFDGAFLYIPDWIVDEFAVYTSQLSAARVLAHAQAAGLA